MLREQLLRLGKQSTVYGLSSVLGASATLILVPLLTRQLSTAQYGMLEVLTVFAIQLGIIVQLGLGAALFRFVLSSDQDVEHSRAVVSTAYWIIAAVSMAAVAAMLPFAPRLAHLLLGQSNLGSLVTWILAKVFFEAVGVVPMARLRLRQAAVVYGALSASRLFVTLGFVVVALSLVNDPLRAVVIAMTAEACTFAIAATATAARDLVPRISVPALQGMLKFGLPLIPYAFALTILAMGDRYFLRTFHGLADVGAYAVGYKLAAVLAIPVRAFQVAWPTFLFSLASAPSGRTFYAKVLIYLLLLLGFCGVAVGVFAREVVDVAAGEAFARAHVVVPILVFAQISLGAFYATAVGTNLSGKTHLVTASAGIALLVFGGAALLLVRPFGIVGAAYATALGYLTLAVADCAFSLRLHPVPYEWGRIAGLAGLILGLIVVGVNIDTGFRVVDVALKFTVVAAYPALVLSFGFLSRSERAAMRGLLARTASYPGVADPEVPGVAVPQPDPSALRQ